MWSKKRDTSGSAVLILVVCFLNCCCYRSAVLSNPVAYSTHNATATE